MIQTHTVLLEIHFIQFLGDQNTYTCADSNPCESNEEGLYSFHKHPNPQMWVQCEPSGVCIEMTCYGDLEWDQDILNCDVPKGKI